MTISYFLFGLKQQLHAVQSTYVEEVLALPELIMIPNSPLGIIGVLDLRGDVLPVLDLQLIIAGQPQPYQLADSIVILKQDELRIGVIVNVVQGIRELLPQEIVADISEYPQSLSVDARKKFLGMIAHDETIFILSEPKHWFKVGEIQQVISVMRFLVDEIRDDAYLSDAQSEVSLSEQETLAAPASFSPTATLEERRIFRERAVALRRSLDENQPDKDAKVFVVVVLNGNLFGIEAPMVREFITIRQATPIPCCPKHIIGNINLRGEILTVIDICQLLNLPLKALPRNPKAVVIELDNIPSVIVVDAIRDASFSINSQDIETSPETDSTSFFMKDNYLQGSISYEGEMMHILDLPMLLQSNDLVVNEIL